MSVIGVLRAESCQYSRPQNTLLRDFLQSYPSDIATVIELEKLAADLSVRKADG